MNVLFLDVDGVLNWYDLRKSGQSVDVINEECCKRVETLLHLFNMKIVVSSTWRHYPELMRMLTSRFGEFVIGTTSREERTSSYFGSDRYRGHLISHWMENNNVDNYLILDDYVNDMEEHSGHYIHTSDLDGFTEEKYREARTLCDNFKYE